MLSSELERVVDKSHKFLDNTPIQRWNELLSPLDLGWSVGVLINGGWWK